MSLTSSLIALGDGSLPKSFEGLRSHVDLSWIEQALELSGVATVRRRKLPAEQVVWLVIGMALYRDRPIPEIVHRLNLVLPGKDGERRDISKGAIFEARTRVGAEPLADLFGLTAKYWAVESANRLRWRGLMVLGADSATLRVPDSGENRRTFHLPGHSNARRSAGYPQVRVTSLMVLRSHLLLDFDVADYKTGEIKLTTPLVDRVPDESLTVLDRNFVNYALLNGIQAKGLRRHWLVRWKSFCKARTVRKIGRGDEIVEIQFTHASRRRNPELPKSFLARVIRYRRKGFKPGKLLTSLLDEALYPASEIIELYHERWEIELGYDEIKTHTLERMEAIRSETPQGVLQEVWGIAVAYNLIRREMEAVAGALGLPPRRISFRGSLMLIRDLFIWAATASPGSLPKMVENMRLDMRHVILPERRSERRYPRHVKVTFTGYPRNHGHPS